MAKRAKRAPRKRPEFFQKGEAQGAALAIMVRVAEEAARLDLLAHSIGIMFDVPKGAFAAALAAHRKQPKGKGE